MVENFEDIILKEIRSYKKEILDIDYAIKLYLGDSSKYSHPGHESFKTRVEKLQSKYEPINNNKIQDELEALHFSFFANYKSWRVLFDRKDKEHFKKIKDNNRKLERLYEKVNKSSEIPENKQNMIKRLSFEYITLQKKLNPDQKIKCYFDEKKYIQMKII